MITHVFKMLINTKDYSEYKKFTKFCGTCGNAQCGYKKFDKGNY